MTQPLPPHIGELVTATGAKQPIIDYVTKDYAGFRQGMLDLIPLLLPQWTDRSESDFGVVLIEMFAYVADILSYYQDRVANEAYLSTATQRRSVVELLRLIDYQVDPGLSATAILHVDVTADLVLSPASLPFRVKATGVPGRPDVVFERTLPATLRLANNALPLPAGLPAQSSSVLLPAGGHALAAGDIVYWEESSPGALVRRSGPLQIVSVTSVGGGQDQIAWLPPLAEAFVAPTHTLLKGNNLLVTHGQTISDEPVYVGDGTDGQTMTLSRKPVSFLLARQAGSLARRSAPELVVKVDGVVWDRVDNFFASSPFDTHYTVSVDENDALTIRFGTGQRGAVVPAGGQVKATYRVGLGQQGNVGAGALVQVVSSLPQVQAVRNPFGAAGGADRESNEEAKISGPGRVISQDRAVTLEDYELLAQAFAGVGKAKARVGLRGGYKVVQLFVVPEDTTGTMPPPLPSEDLKDGLKQSLEARMPVNRMAGVDVLDPTYVAIDITLEVHVRADASASVVQAAVLAVLQDRLSFAQVSFAQAIRVGDVYTTVYPVPGIAFVQLRRLARSTDPAGASAPCALQDVALLENELPFAGTLSVQTIGGGP